VNSCHHTSSKNKVNTVAVEKAFIRSASNHHNYSLVMMAHSMCRTVLKNLRMQPHHIQMVQLLTPKAKKGEHAAGTEEQCTRLAVSIAEIVSENINKYLLNFICCKGLVPAASQPFLYNLQSGVPTYGPALPNR
jgi:hypothetical protein